MKVYCFTLACTLRLLISNMLVVQQTLCVTTAVVTRKIVLTSNCPYSEGPLQSEYSDWLPMTLSLHRDCPYIKCPYKESLL